MAPDHAEAREAVAATPAALEVIHRLSAAHGPLMFDMHLGEVAGGI